ncbi:MAG: PA14 domain-containing protein, partial [Planctomycetota bacterium]|nr:PA14 domain-containing protein [Planctomycetota bacterium]
MEQRQLLSTVALLASDDAHVRLGSNANNNYQNDNFLQVRYAGDSANNSRETYVKFDTSSLVGKTIVSAQLVMTGNGPADAATTTPPAVNGFNNGVDNRINAYGVPDTTWTQATIKANNRPDPALDVKLDNILAHTGDFTQYVWNVTDWVQAQVTASATQTSLRLTEVGPTTGSGRQDFLSKENPLVVAAGASGPMLVVNVDDGAGYNALTVAPSRVVPNSLPTEITLVWIGAPDDASYNILRSEDGGGTFTNIANTPDHNFIDSTVTPGTSYNYIIQAVGADATTLDSVMTNAVVASSVPAAWGTTDIGRVNLPGSANESAGVFTISNSGADIWGGNDQMRYTFLKDAAGDGTLTLRIVSNDNLGGWGKVGPMFRGGTDQGNNYVFAASTGGNGQRLQGRITNFAADNFSDDWDHNYSTIQVPAIAVSAPVWMRLTRNGNMFLAETSADDGSGNPLGWEPLGTMRQVSLGTNALVGIAVGSGNGTLDTAIVDNVTWAPAAPIAAPEAFLTVSGTAWKVEWNTNPAATGFLVERSTSADFSTDLKSFNATGTSYTDATVSKTTKYFYRVTAQKGAASSAPSKVIGGILVTPILGTPAFFSGTDIFGNNLGGGLTQYQYSQTWLGGTPIQQRTTPWVNFTGDSGYPLNAQSVNDNQSAFFRGQVLIDKEADYVFYGSSDDESRVWVDGVDVASNGVGTGGGGHGMQEPDLVAAGGGAATAYYINPIHLTVGWHNVYAMYTQGGGGYGLMLKMADASIFPTVRGAVIPTDHLRPDVQLVDVAPTDLAITNDPTAGGYEGYLALGWTDASSNEASFLLQRATDTDFTDPITIKFTAGSTDIAAITSAFDVLVAPNTQYFYRVLALNADGIASDPSNVVTWTSPATGLSLTATYPDGTGGARANYHIGRGTYTPANTPDFIRLEPTIDNDFGNGSPDNMVIPNDNFSARWTGQLNVATAGSYVFQTNTDDGARLWIDGNLVIDNWVDKGYSDTNSAAIALTVGKHELWMEFYENGGGAGARLRWIEPGATTSVTIPDTVLMPVASKPAAPTGFSARIASTKIKVTFTEAAKNEIVTYVQRSTTSTFTPATTHTIFSQPLNYSTGQVVTFVDAGLTPSTTYYYRVVSQNYDAQSITLSGAQTTPDFDVLPDAPTNVKIFGTGFYGSTGIALFWTDNAFNEDGFRILRSDTGADGTFAPLPAGSIAEDSNKFVDMTAVAGNTYFYKIQVWNVIGSVDSAIGSATAAPMVVGTGTGLTGRYYANTIFEGAPIATRTDATVDFSYQNNCVVMPANWPSNFNSVEWKGRVQAQITGYYLFATASDDMTGLWISDQSTPIVSNFYWQGETQRQSAPIYLEAGTFYNIRMTFVNGGGGSSARLRWQNVDQGLPDWTIIPATQLYTVDPAVAPVAVQNVAVDARNNYNYVKFENYAAGNDSINILRADAAAGPFVKVGTSTADSRAFLDYGIVDGKEYWYIVRNANGALESADSNVAHVAASTAKPLTAGWKFVDIGNAPGQLGDPELPGDAAMNDDGTIRVTASGRDIWNTVDQGGYLYQELPNTDFTITVKGDSLTDTNWWAKGGIMVRDSLAPASRKVMMVRTPYNHGITEFSLRRFEGRDWQSFGSGADGSSRNFNGVDYDTMLFRLERINDVFKGYFSIDDGLTWSQVGNVDGEKVVMQGEKIFVGLAVTSHTATKQDEGPPQLATGVFSGLTFEHTKADGSLEPLAPYLATIPAAPTDLVAVEGAGSGLIQLNWTDNSGNEAGFDILRSNTLAGTYAKVGTAAPNATEFTDRGLPAASTRYYKIQAVNAAGKSALTSPAVNANAGALADINFTDFADPSLLTLNGSAVAAVDNGAGALVLRLTPALNDQIASVYATDLRDITAFKTAFDFNINNGNWADGFTFAIQNADYGVNAIGQGGGNMGWGGYWTGDPAVWMPGVGVRSLAVKFDNYPNGAEHTSSTGLFYNEESIQDFDTWQAGITYSVNMLPFGIDLQSAHTFHVTLDYNGRTLFQTVTDTVTSAKFTWQYDVNIPLIMGSTTAFVGFTGATGCLNQNQDILTWQFKPEMPIIDTETPWVIDLTDGNDIASLKRSGANVQLLNAVGGLVEQRDIGTIASITVNGKLGNDVITLDLSGGLLTNPGKPLTINGDAGSDTLKLKGVDLTGLDVSVG